jgi:hypothetical protein
MPPVGDALINLGRCAGDGLIQPGGRVSRAVLFGRCRRHPKFTSRSTKQAGERLQAIADAARRFASANAPDMPSAGDLVSVLHATIASRWRVVTRDVTDNVALR